MTSDAKLSAARARQPGVFRKLGGDLWRFFTSIRLAIVLITLIAVIGTVGTLFPQADRTRTVDYIARYGLDGYRWIQAFQLDRIFSSVYFWLVMATFFTNMLACTAKRLKTSLHYFRTPQHAKRAEAFSRMPVHAEVPAPAPEALLARAEALLRERRYRVRRQGDQLLAEKWRWERFGIDVFHLGILVLLVGGMLTATLGHREFVVAHEGQVFAVPAGGFDVRVDKFWSTNYAKTERVMDWHTTLTVIEGGQETLTQTIEVNAPLLHNGVRLFQSSFGQDWENAARVKVRVATAQGATVGEYLASVDERFAVPELGIQVEVGAFLPDFALTENQVAYSRSQRLDNPAVYLRVFDAQGKLVHRTWALSQLPELQQMLSGAPYLFYLEGMSAPEFTGIQVNVDPGYNVAIASFAIMMLGILVHLYFKHRQLWVVSDRAARVLRLGGRARHHGKGFEDEFARLVKELQAPG